MRKLRITAVLEYDDEIMHGSDPESIHFFNDAIIGGPNLTLCDTGDLGDEIGTLKVLEWEVVDE